MCQQHPYACTQAVSKHLPIAVSSLLGSSQTHLVGVDLLALWLVHPLALQELAPHNAAVPDGRLKDEQAVIHHEVAQHKAAA
jgi:hypothetical protein